MAFINTKPVNTDKISQPAIQSIGPEKTIICRNPDKLRLLLNLITPNNNVHYVSNGDWSMHNLAIELIKTHQPAELYFSTYALRETPVRQLVLALHKGELTKIKMLVDTRAKIRTPEVFELAKMNFCELYQTNIHAKVFVLKSPKGYVTTVGSANWTTNPKIEAGVVTTSEDVGKFHIDWMEKIMQDAEIFK